jgi:hypothetical protein
MSNILYLYKNCSLSSLVKNVNFDFEKLESILAKCRQINPKINAIKVTIEKTAHRANPFRCKIWVDKIGKDIEVIQSGKEAFDVVNYACQKTLDIIQKHHYSY